MDKPIRHSAWFFVLPAFALVVFNAVVPMMTVFPDALGPKSREQSTDNVRMFPLTATFTFWAMVFFLPVLVFGFGLDRREIRRHSGYKHCRTFGK